MTSETGRRRAPTYVPGLQHSKEEHTCFDEWLLGWDYRQLQDSASCSSADRPRQTSRGGPWRAVGAPMGVPADLPSAATPPPTMPPTRLLSAATPLPTNPPTRT